MKSYARIWVLVCAVAAIGGYALLWHLVAAGAPIIRRLDNISSNPNPLVRHFSPTWRSLKKTLDIPFIIYAAFHPSSLPVYSITISKQAQITLLTDLPDYPRQNKLTTEYDKKNVTGGFGYGTYHTTQAQIRYRGVSPNHWDAVKKSTQVNLPKKSPLEGRTAYRFFLGEDKGWVRPMLFDHIADKLGIMALGAQPARLIVNGKDAGVYDLIEGWEPSLLDRYGKPAGPLFSNQNTNTKNVDLWRSDQISEWYNRNEPLVPAESFPQLVELLRVVSQTSDAEFAREIPAILDIPTFLRWSVVTILSGNFHQGNIANMNFYFNPETKKFEPILFDATPSPIGPPANPRKRDLYFNHETKKFEPILSVAAPGSAEATVDLRNHRVVNRLLQNDAFRKEFESLMAAYVSDDKNLKDDLAFYDQWAEKVKPAIFADTAKIQTSIEALEFIQDDRDYYEYNYLTLQKMFRENGRLRYTFADETYPITPVTN